MSNTGRIAPIARQKIDGNRRFAWALVLLAGGVGACGGGDAAIQTGEPAEPLQILGSGRHSIQGLRTEAIGVRTGRRVVVVVPHRRSVNAASPRARLVSDLDGDGQPEVAASVGAQFAHRLVVDLSGSANAVDVRRAKWNVNRVLARKGGQWIVLADGPAGGPHLLGFAPRQRRWTWSVRLPGHEIDDVDDFDIRGDTVRVAVAVPTGDAASVVLDLNVHGDKARVTRTDARPAHTYTRGVRIAPAWRLEEVGDPPREEGGQSGRIELTRPGGERQTLAGSDERVPAAYLLRAGPACAVVVQHPTGAKSTVTAIGADGRIRATQIVPRAGFAGLVLVGRRLLLARREDSRTVVRPLRTDPKIGSCG